MSKKSNKVEAEYSKSAQLIYGPAKSPDWNFTRHVVPPLTASSTFRLESAKRGAEGFGRIGQGIPEDPDFEPIFVYDRMGEPNNNMLEDNLTLAEEGAAAVTFSSGMAAVHAATSFALNKDSEIISQRTVYGCTYSLFTQWYPKYNIPVHFVDLKDPDGFLPLVNDNTRILYLESPANPTLDLLDLEAIVSRVNEINKNRPPDKQILTVMDNTFATPWCQRPISFGVDIVVHSLTKGLSGFGTEMGGAVISRKKEDKGPLIIFRKDFGGTLSPATAWHILVYGVSTLALRVPKQIQTAIKVANFLEGHPEVETVLYPGLESFPQYEIAKRHLKDYDGNFAPGFMLYFIVKGKDADHARTRGEEMMDYIADNAYSITLAVSLGQLRTLVEHPGSMTHRSYPIEEQIKLGMHPGGIRLAIGIEDPEDIIRDLESALKAVK